MDRALVSCYLEHPVLLLNKESFPRFSAIHLISTASFLFHLKNSSLWLMRFQVFRREKVLFTVKAVEFKRSLLSQFIFSVHCHSFEFRCSGPCSIYRGSNLSLIRILHIILLLKYHRILRSELLRFMIDDVMLLSKEFEHHRVLTRL